MTDDAEIEQLPSGKKITKTITVKSEDLKREDEAEPAVIEQEPEPEDFFDDDLSDTFFDDDEIGIDFVEVYRLSGGTNPKSGKVSFVDNFPYSDSIRADIRTSCGGGKFIVLQRGTHPETGRKGIIRRKTIDIEGQPKEYNAAPATNAVQHAQQPAIVNGSPRSFLDQAREFAEVADAFGLKPQRVQPASIGAITSSSPTEQLNETVNLIKTVTATVKDLLPEPPVSSGGDGGGWLTGIAAIARELNLKEVIGPFIGALMQAAASRGQVPGAQPQNGAAPQPAVLPAVPPEAKQAMDYFIAQMAAYMEPEEFAKELIEARVAQPGFVPLIDAWMNDSPVVTLQSFAMFPEYRVTAMLRESATWLLDVQDDYVALQQKDSESPGQEDAATILNFDGGKSEIEVESDPIPA